MENRGRVGAVLLFLGVIIAGIGGYAVMRLNNLSFEEQMQIRMARGGREAALNGLYGGYAGLGVGVLLLIVGLIMLLQAREPTHGR